MDCDQYIQEVARMIKKEEDNADYFKQPQSKDKNCQNYVGANYRELGWEAY